MNRSAVNPKSAPMSPAQRHRLYRVCLTSLGRSLRSAAVWLMTCHTCAGWHAMALAPPCFVPEPKAYAMFMSYVCSLFFRNRTGRAELRAWWHKNRHKHTHGHAIGWGVWVHTHAYRRQRSTFAPAGRDRRVEVTALNCIFLERMQSVPPKQSYVMPLLWF